jgi:hypothetical protein
MAGVKAIRKEGKEFLSALETSAVHQSAEPEKIAGFCLARQHEEVPSSGRTKMCRSMRPAIGDHAPMERFDPLAGGTLAKAGHEGMQKAGAAGEKQGAGKGKGYALMLEIAFTDGLGMADK